MTIVIKKVSGLFQVWVNGVLYDVCASQHQVEETRDEIRRELIEYQA